MRPLPLIMAIALICTPSALAQNAPPPTPDASEYWGLKQARIDAYRTRDRAAYERFLADDFITMTPDGRRLDRAAYLAAEFGEQSADAPQVETTVSDFRAHRAGQVLVLTYNELERVAVGAQTFESRLGRLDVYVRRDGRWRLQTMTAVRLPEAPPTITVPRAKLRDYVGVYIFGPGVTSTVRLDGDRLLEQSTGNPESELLPVGPDEFYAPPDLEARALFERNAAGQVIAQIYRSGSQRLRAPRTGP